MPNSSCTLRVLLLADSHLGFDLPIRPRVKRRRRGYDFQSNHEEALRPALEGKVDLVVHGGDVFHRPHVPPSLVHQAFEPLLKVAESGVPVFVVPGNHERSRIPHDRFAAHPRLHIFRGPETRVVQLRGMRVALSGFPYHRRGIRDRFPGVLEETDWRRKEADIRLLCLHHCVEGATVGPSDFTFRFAPDVIRCGDLPPDFAAVLSGHIHRHQVLRRDLDGRILPTPVLYPGSIERTAFAEMDEAKGFLIFDIEAGPQGGKLGREHFVPLPARPMVLRELYPRAGMATGWLGEDLEAQLRTTLADTPENAVLRIRIHGQVEPHLRPLLTASHMRRISPTEMNIEVLLVEGAGPRHRTRPRRRGQEAHETHRSGPAGPPVQIGLDLGEVA